jgi:hypothetical protein
MKRGRKVGMVAVVIACATATLIAEGTAAAAKGGGGGGLGGGGGGLGGRASVISITDNCGGTLDLRERVAGSLVVGITEISGDKDDVWSLRATQQEYDVTTGARTGAPIDLVPDVLPQLAFVPADGFTSTATVDDTPNVTHGFSYVATRTSPSPVTCTGVAYWTDHDGATTPDPLNPTAKPDTAPTPTGDNTAHDGTNVVSVQFDQEMLATTQGIPTVGRFLVTVDGVSRDVTGVDVTDDSPPNRAAVSLTLAGDPLTGGSTVTVQYRQALLRANRQLQDLDGLMVSSFGPVTATVS